MEISFTLPEWPDVDELVENMLPADYREIRALGYDPRFALEQSIANSVEYVAARVDGKLACITGLAVDSPLGEGAYPWLISTPVIFTNPLAFMRYTKKIVGHWQELYPFMANYVDERHCLAVRWLRHIGAEIHPAEPYGPYRRPFHRFTFGEPSCV